MLTQEYSWNWHNLYIQFNIYLLMVILHIFVFFKQAQNISIFVVNDKYIWNRLLKEVDSVVSLQTIPV